MSDLVGGFKPAGELISVGRALELIGEHATALPASAHPLLEAVGLVLAEPVAADCDAPPFDKALVDGYAVRSSDLAREVSRLRIVGVLHAGRTASRAIGPGEALRIMTGAPIPPGADTVVMHERTHVEGDYVIVEEVASRPGQNILPRGREARAGAVVLASGSILTAARLGVAASFGRTTILAVPRPRVAVVATGDELVEPGQAPGPGQIRNSSSTTLAGLVLQAGSRPRVLPIAPDEPAALAAVFAKGLESDVLVISGGVSVGSHDLVPEVLESLGVTRVFHKVRIKPGKPIWFGVKSKGEGRPGTLVFGLPGNPVGSLVGFLVFVRAALAGLAGRWGEAQGRARLPLAGPFVHRGDRPTIRRL
jgi:molybdopterin molybdotransferase